MPHDTSVWGWMTATGEVVAGAPGWTTFTDPVPLPGEQSKFHSRLHDPLATLKLCDLPVPIPLSLRINLVEGEPEVGGTVVRVAPAGAMVLGDEVEDAAEVHAVAIAPAVEMRRTMSPRLTPSVESLGIATPLREPSSPSPA